MAVTAVAVTAVAVTAVGGDGAVVAVVAAGTMMHVGRMDLIDRSTVFRAGHFVIVSLLA